MDSVRAGTHLTWVRSVALLAILALSLAALSMPRDAEARTCHTVAQNITKLKNVSCKRAKKVVNRTYRSSKVIPECKGEPTIRFRGWKFKAIDNRGIIVRVTKGNKRFILSGGGAC